MKRLIFFFYKYVQIYVHICKYMYNNSNIPPITIDIILWQQIQCITRRDTQVKLEVKRKRNTRNDGLVSVESTGLEKAYPHCLSSRGQKPISQL